MASEKFTNQLILFLVENERIETKRTIRTARTRTSSTLPRREHPHPEQHLRMHPNPRAFPLPLLELVARLCRQPLPTLSNSNLTTSLHILCTGKSSISSNDISTSMAKPVEGFSCPHREMAAVTLLGLAPSPQENQNLARTRRGGAESLRGQSNANGENLNNGVGGTIASTADNIGETRNTPSEASPLPSASGPYRDHYQHGYQHLYHQHQHYFPQSRRQHKEEDSIHKTTASTDTTDTFAQTAPTAQVTLPVQPSLSTQTTWPTTSTHSPPPSSAPTIIANHCNMQFSTSNCHLPSSSLFLCMSSIGFGVDPDFDGRDATEACVRAINDSMLRSTLRLSSTATPSTTKLSADTAVTGCTHGTTTSTSKQFGQSLHVKLGVPIGLQVNKLRLEQHVLSPAAASSLVVEIVTGGLAIMPEEKESSGPSICTVVACITLNQYHHHEPSTSNHTGAHTETETVSHTQTSLPPCHTNNAAGSLSIEGNDYLANQIDTNTGIHQTPPCHTVVEDQTRQPQHSFVPATPTVPVSSDRRMPHRTKSMEMLAMISEKLASAANIPSLSTAIALNGQPTYQASTGLATQALLSATSASSCGHPLVATPTRAPSMPPTPSAGRQIHQDLHSSQMQNGEEETEDGDDDYRDNEGDANSNYNYQKLPPGLTMKNNRRLFVKHSYQDFSHEKPVPDELPLTIPGHRAPNAAFPLKLHEILSQIEEDHLSHIVGWLPHGRSFRIHQQREFAECILPKYFTITKKSSFLRQLNLYGFNRFSAGPDQGSYYHEKFLRGMKFLTKRMNRQKVNGNRIRSAGNPDEEPALATYPVCPVNRHETTMANETGIPC